MNIGNMTLKVFLFLFYLIIWRKGTTLLIDDFDLQILRKTLLLNIVLVIILAMLSFALGSFHWYSNLIKVYLPAYMIISIIFLARTNLTTAYNEKNKNVINKSKNIQRFNIISTLIVIVLIIAIATDFFGVGSSNLITKGIENIYNILERFLTLILYPVVWVISKVIEMIMGNSKSNYQDISSGMEEASKRQLERDLPDLSESHINEILLNVIEGAKWFILGIIILAIIYFIYKNMREIYISNKVEESDEGEEKSFVINKGDIIKGIRKPFKFMKNGISKIVGKKGQNFKDLHAIRRIYFQVIIKLDKDGYKFPKHLTPNEYLIELEKKSFHQPGLDILTEYYNEVRYGKKLLGQDKVNECIEIKNKIERQ